MPSPVIVSLDVDAVSEAFELVQRLGPKADHYKIGLQLLTAEGPHVVRTLVADGQHVFLDLKLHEIPNSVASAVRAAGGLGVSMVAVHASAGSAVLRAAVDAARAFPRLKVLGLTVITSLADTDLPEIGLAPSVEAQVRRLALLARDAGCHGVVASAREASWLRPLLSADICIVCPGIQLGTDGASDHVRVATPFDAAQAGADHVVLGRAITQAPDPAEAFRSAVALFRAGRDTLTESGSHPR